MNIVFSAGGTLGHILPAISIASIFKKINPNLKIFLFATINDQKYLEKIKLKDIDEIIYFRSSGIYKNIFKTIKSVFINLDTFEKVKAKLKEKNIKIVFGMGGYLSGITVKAAYKQKLLTIIHEQNKIMGKANKMSLKYANTFLTSFPMAKVHKSQILLGNPRMFEAKPLIKNKYQILIMSGTKGSKFINSVASKFLNHPFSKLFKTILITGDKYYEQTKNSINEGTHFEIYPFSKKILDYLSTCAIVISRSGASSLFEIIASKAVPIFIPSPNVTNNHQFFNAQEIANEKIGYLIEEKDFEMNKLIHILEEILINYNIIQTRINDYLQKFKKENLEIFLKSLKEA